MKIHKVIAIVDRTHAQYADFWRFEADVGQDLTSPYSVRIRYDERNIKQIKLWLRMTKQAFLQDEWDKTFSKRERVTRKGLIALREFRRQRAWLKRLKELEFVNY